MTSHSEETLTRMECLDCRSKCIATSKLIGALAGAALMILMEHALPFSLTIAGDPVTEDKRTTDTTVPPSRAKRKQEAPDDNLKLRSAIPRLQLVPEGRLTDEELRKIDPYAVKNPFEILALGERRVAPGSSANEFIGALVRGATLGLAGPTTRGTTPEAIAQAAGLAISIGAVFVAAFAVRAGRRRTEQARQEGAVGELALKVSRMRNLGVAAILCGVALVVFNLFNYNTYWSQSGVFYPESARLGMAVGAVLLTAGIFMYRRGQGGSP